jgi:hypothetical protein
MKHKKDNRGKNVVVMLCRPGIVWKSDKKFFLFYVKDKKEIPHLYSSLACQIGRKNNNKFKEKKG